MSQDEDEWEYEYDHAATETFLLDLDLTSLNTGLKSNIPGKRPLDRPEHLGRTKVSHADVHQQPTPIEEDLDATPSASIGLEHPFGPAPNSLQVLNFHSLNPIVSYENEIYSCTWSDMVGTNMFFALPTSQWPEAEEAVELLGTSRIRLIGHKAKTEVRQDTIAESAVEKGSRRKGASPSSNSSHLNPAIKRQAEFLERLKDVKRAKGDTDVVRTVMPT